MRRWPSTRPLGCSSIALTRGGILWQTETLALMEGAAPVLHESLVSARPAENILGSIESNGVFKWTLEAVSGDLADAVTNDSDSDNNDSSSYDG